MSQGTQTDFETGENIQKAEAFCLLRAGHGDPKIRANRMAAYVLFTDIPQIDGIPVFYERCMNEMLIQVTKQIHISKKTGDKSSLLPRKQTRKKKKIMKKIYNMKK